MILASVRPLGDLGELRTVEGAGWDLEIGAISEADYKRGSPPALLFDAVPGYAWGPRVLTAGTEVPGGVSELDHAGAVRGRPVDVVRGQDTGLPIPATAEVAVEGWLYPDRNMNRFVIAVDGDVDPRSLN